MRNPTGAAPPPAFHPLDLGADLIAWWDADLGVTLNGSRAAAWADQSGHGYHATMSTSSSQPLRVAAAMGARSVLRFDSGRLDHMIGTISVQEACIVAAVKMNAVQDNAVIELAPGMGVNTGFALFRETSPWKARRQSGGASTGAANTSPCIVSGYFTAAEARIWKDGVEGTPHVAARTMPTCLNFVIGRLFGGFYSATMDIGSIALCTPNTAHRRNLEVYMGTRYTVAVA